MTDRMSNNTAGLEFRLHKNPLQQKIELFILWESGDQRYVGEPFKLRRNNINEVIGEPTAQLNMHQAQMLMDELWNCGIRPTEGTGSAGSLAATEKHLRDMQAIAIGLLRKDGVSI